MFPNAFPQPAGVPVWPAICFTLSAQPDEDLGGAPSEESMDSEITIEAVAPTYVAVRALQAEIVKAMRAVPAGFDGAGGITYDAETKSHRAGMRFRFAPSSEPADSD